MIVSIVCIGNEMVTYEVQNFFIGPEIWTDKTFAYK